MPFGKISPQLKITAVVAVLILAAYGGLYLYWLKNYQDRIYPGVKIADIDLGGTSREQAREILKTRTNKITDTGLSFTWEDQELIMDAAVVSFDADLSYPALVFEVEEMLNKAYGRDEDRGFLAYLRSWFKNLKSNQRQMAIYNLDEKKVVSWLEKNFSDLNIEPVNAYFSLSNGGDGELVKNPEKMGQEIDYEIALKDVNDQIAALNLPWTKLEIQALYPAISQADLPSQEEEIKSLLKKEPPILTAKNIKTASGKTTWRLSPEIFITWIKTEKENGELELVMDQEKINLYLEEKIAPQINQEATLPRFEIKDERISVWQVGKPGWRLNSETSATKIAQEFFDDKKEIDLLIEEVAPDKLTADNDFQIKELIGTGQSNFGGSSSNRRHNIKVGADSLHGLLIKPGEDFSLLKALGDIDASTGYVTELVIKGDRTVPEYGGGLCQIGTTMFRTALASGLPITERRNHSFRVSYYEPAGTDATIYDPAPDFRFFNDTGNYVLIQARIEGDLLYFDFWGTSDGRVATTTYPVIYNIVKPPPTKLIETDELAPGETKCTEKAQDGASAYFDYTVIYPERATSTPVQTERFYSRYVPWQAVCLVGREKAPEGNPEEGLDSGLESNKEGEGNESLTE